MIDSINQVVEKIKNLDRKYLKKELNIDVNDTIDKYGNHIQHFVYDNIKFIHHIVGRNLRIETTTHKILDKMDITLSDKEVFKNKINDSLNKVLNTKGINYTIKQSRNDYHTDINVADKMEIYLKHLQKYSSSFGHLKAKNKYSSSVSLSTRTGRKLIFYDREKCIKQKANKKIKKIKSKYKDDKEKMNFKIKELEEYTSKQCDLYKGILRLELQIPKRTLKSYERTSKKANKIDSNVVIAYRKIDYYWNKNTMEKYYFKALKKYIYGGDYYKLNNAIEIIQNSNLTDKWKYKLICFLGVIKYYGIDQIKEVEVYSYGTFKDYVARLEKMGINPITLDDDCKYSMLEGLYSLARKKAEADYFI